jgi:hypothetical protein
MCTSLSLSRTVSGRLARRCAPFLWIERNSIPSNTSTKIRCRVNISAHQSRHHCSLQSILGFIRGFSDSGGGLPQSQGDIATGFAGYRTGCKRLVHNGNTGEGKPPADVESRLLMGKQIRADNFVKSLMAAKFEKVPGACEMEVVRGVCDLETGEPNVDVIVRNITLKFWKSCIETVDAPGQRYRVAAIGTPGIGKTFTTPILIRLLLEAGHTVVYHVSTTTSVFQHTSDGCFYEFSPGIGGPCKANVYHGRTAFSDIPSLTLDSTYFVVDPGRSKENCVPPKLFQPKVIVVASPNSRHWGRFFFDERRSSVKGSFKMYPIWTLDELLDAQPIIYPEMSKDTVLRRFHLFGGVPRHVFWPAESVDLLRTQDFAVNNIKLSVVESICRGFTEEVRSFDPSAPRSALIGFELAPDDNGMFKRYVPVLLSDTVKVKVYSKFIRNLWNIILSRKGNGPAIFESYLQSLLSGPTGTSVPVYARSHFGAENRSLFDEFRLPCCQDVLLAADLFETIVDPNSKPFVLYVSSKSNHPLFDSVYKDKNTRTIYAVQGTTGVEHDSNPYHLAEFLRLMDGMGTGWKMLLLYLIPSDKCRFFHTKPVDPIQGPKRQRDKPQSPVYREISLRHTRGQVEIKHVAVSNPTLKADAVLAQLTRRSEEK